LPQEALDASTRPEQHRPMLFALCFFHALALGRRKFGFQGFSRQYPFNNGDITVCAQVMHNYLEVSDDVPWDDLQYNFGEIMYGGHITDFWDRRITNTYLKVLLSPGLLDEKSALQLAPGYPACLEGDAATYAAYIEENLPAESPVLFGLHPNSQISLLQQQAATLFSSVLVLSGSAGGGGGGGQGDARGGHARRPHGETARAVQDGGDQGGAQGPEPQPQPQP
jgi:dynein heavy chain